MKSATESVSFIKKKKKNNYRLLSDDIYWKRQVVLVSVDSALGYRLVLVLSLLKSSRNEKLVFHHFFRCSFVFARLERNGNFSY